MSSDSKRIRVAQAFSRRELARVFAGELAAGQHSFQWNVRGTVPAGVYACVIRLNGSVQEVPVVVTR